MTNIPEFKTCGEHLLLPSKFRTYFVDIHAAFVKINFHNNATHIDREAKDQSVMNLL